ncbi:uncharacterized protein L201_002541 [Kwoniella dendrophila CBS 6074]|uniref:Indigoidine synthase A family protein n=1 Tax=Kwoniella dendrophila CBS 6074 TaxID=1295534 RepID=A0AAX4JRC7_9TREE
MLMISPITRRGLNLKVGHTLRSRRGIYDLARGKQLWGNRLVISEEVHEALSTSKPIIALESTIITHGMPYPTNSKTANSLENIIRSKGVIPATIALINGRIHIGLTDSELMQLSDSNSNLKDLVKISRRDLGPSIALKRSGGTTVAGTMYIAESLGIKIFVTGGIGGVHRGAENSMDISADLLELGRTPMAVFCAGAKSILDIPRTLEVLETQGVCVASYGNKQDFPAFYTPSSGCQSPWRVGDAEAAARLIYTQLTLPNKLATLFGVPIPSQHAEAGEEVQKSVEQAVRESVEQGIDKKGKEVTPWLLKRVGELTGGKSLGLNVNLIENNARIGAEVAINLSEIYKSEFGNHGNALNYIYSSPAASNPTNESNLIFSQDKVTFSTKSENITIPTHSSGSTLIPIPSSSSKAVLAKPTVLVFGSAAIDLTSTSPHTLEPRTTTPGTVFVSPGGVGRNIAEAAQNFLPENSVQLISLFGTNKNTPSIPKQDQILIDEKIITSDTAKEVEEPDSFGKLLLLELNSAGLRTDGLIGKSGKSTAVCSLTLEKNGDLVAGVADMGIVEIMSIESVEQSIRQNTPEMVVFDCNLTEKVIRKILQICGDLNIPTFCDPTSLPKIPRLTSSLISALPESPGNLRPLTQISPNVLELDQIYQLINEEISNSDEIEKICWEYINSLNLNTEFRNQLDNFLSKLENQNNDIDVKWIKENGIIQKIIKLLPFIQSFWLKNGSKGLIHFEISPSPVYSSSRNNSRLEVTYKLDENSRFHSGKSIKLTYYQSPKINQNEIISTTGAGDTLVGGLVAGLINNEKNQYGHESEWVKKALENVKKSLKSRRAVG